MLTILIKNKFVFLYLAECDAALGFETFEVYDSQLTTQSDSIRIILDNGKDMDIHAGCARLNLHYCAICGSSKNGQYFQVDLRQDHTIIGVATQGFQALITYFVRSYNLTHSRDGQTWSIFPVSINLTFSEVNGNNDGNDNINSNTEQLFAEGEVNIGEYSPIFTSLRRIIVLV